MKKIIQYTWLFCIIVAAGSCKKYLDVNNNPNAATKPPINGLLLSATENVAYNVFLTSNTTSYYTQYLASSNAASPTDTYEPIDASETWTRLYDNMTDVYDMDKLAAELGATQYQGLARILTAMDLQQVHDLWGDAPFDEAFSGEILTPAYQDGQTIYQTVLSLLDEGISLIQQSGSTIELDGDADLIHGGNVDAWVRTAHAVKARMLNRISKQSNYDPQAVLAEIDKAYTLPEQEAKVTVFNEHNWWDSVARDNEALLLDGWLSEHFINTMNGTIYGLFDPRLPLITDTTKYGDYRGTRNGKGRKGSGIEHEECYLTTTGYYSSSESPAFVFSFEELKFLEAEAAFRANDKSRAYQAYLDGIKVNMEKMKVNPELRDDYINAASVSVGEANLTLEDIFREKYKANFLSPETWSDMRRFDYQYKDFQLPLNAALTVFVRRLVYPRVETSRNSANVPQVSGTDEKLWWDQ
jgi:hypothetical protein